MARRKRSDSLDTAKKIAAKAFDEILPPDHIVLDDGDRVFFRNVISEFAKSEWTDHQLEIAGMLARTMADLDREQRTLRNEGFIAVRENGTTVENPRSRVVKSLTGDILSLRRSLSLHARAKGGESRDVAKRRGQKKVIEKGVCVDDDLIARPTVN